MHATRCGTGVCYWDGLSKTGGDGELDRAARDEDVTLTNLARSVPLTKMSAHFDGWRNINGLGTERDKGTFAECLPTVQLSSNAKTLWRGDDMADKIVTSLPGDALREGSRCRLCKASRTGSANGDGRSNPAANR